MFSLAKEMLKGKDVGVGFWGLFLFSTISSSLSLSLDVPSEKFDSSWQFCLVRATPRRLGRN